MNRLITPSEFINDFINIEAKACNKNNLSPGSLIQAMAKAYNARIESETKTKKTKFPKQTD